MPLPETVTTNTESHINISQSSDQSDLRERIRQRDGQRKVDRRLEARMAKRREKEKAKEEVELARAEKARLQSIASVEQARELWRLQEEARSLKRREEQKLRDEAGMRAGGGYKRPAVGHQATEPCVKRSAVSMHNRPYRYANQV